MTIYLHIGAHKTATSSLQELMLRNIDPLRQEDICAIPRRLIGAGRDTNLRYRELIKNLLDAPVERNEKQPAREELYGLLLAHRNNARNLVISDESLLGPTFDPTGILYPNARRRIETLSQLFSGERIRVILYVRDQNSFLESRYLLCLLHRHIMTFSEFMAGVDTDRLHWSRVAMDIETAIGAENLQVFRFEEIRNGFIPMAEKFFRCFCDPSMLTLTEIQSNPSPSALGISLIRAIAPLVTDEEWKPFRKIIQEEFHAKKQPPEKLLDAPMRAYLNKTYAPDTERVLLQFGDNARNWHYTKGVFSG